MPASPQSCHFIIIVVVVVVVELVVVVAVVVVVVVCLFAQYSFMRYFVEKRTFRKN